jgi:hypothetical protein
MIQTERVTVAVAGAAGSGAGEGTTRKPVNGKLVAIHLDFVTQPATTDVTITTPGAPSKTLLTTTDVNTDGWYYPRYVVHSEVGAALTGTAGGDRTMHPIDDYIKVVVAQGDPGSVIASFLYES